ncbi:S8 family serine peptidase [Deinococcus pimensis]|uniref:S8 family serine peptidase n=1 Tax=Deinococcus pimensis TaxID=309888 RepID=UPI0004815FE9|nr:S8 family serine peptidase [Deinococcus pimensis]
MKKSLPITALGVALLFAACGQQTTAPSASGTNDVGALAAGPTYAVGFVRGRGVDRNAVRNAGGTISDELPEIDAAIVRLPAKAVAALRNNPNVEFVEENVQRRALGNPSAQSDAPGTIPAATTTAATTGIDWQPSGEYTYGDVALNVPQIQQQYGNTSAGTGIGTAVCVGDTGIDATHPEFAGRLKGFKNFVAEARRDDPYQLNDVDHHGTHVSGTIFAQYGQGTGGRTLTGMDANGVGGVAPGVNLYMARVLGDDGSGSSAEVSRGVMWCTKLLKNQGGYEQRVVISLSLGSTQPSRLEARAFAKAIDAGALVVAAAGNDGNNLPHYPSDYPGVVKVGAVDNHGGLASFSNYGKNQTLVAPGVSVLSTVPVGQGLEASASVPDAGTYSSVIAAEFAREGDVSGQVVAANSGVASDTGNLLCGVGTANPALKGKIALISRGSCSFGEKIDNAVRSGALAAIIYNNVDEDLNATLGSQKTIPVVGINKADGLRTLAAAPTNGRVAIVPADYEAYNGTSMATPHVSGAAALVWAAKPNLTARQVIDLLTATATDLGPAGRDDKFGYGLVDPLKAIQAQK